MSRFRQALKSGLTFVLPRSWLVASVPPPRRLRVPPAGAVEIALTFDDGPHPEHTSRVLDTLGEAGLKGTFFVIGEKAEQHPTLVRRIADEGHALGNHTWTHSEPSLTSARQFLDEVDRTRRLLQDITGRDCRWTRPPKGRLTVKKAIGLWRRKQTIVLWNVDPKDFAMRAAADMARWCEQFSPRSGDIVLLHDHQPFATECIARLATGSAHRRLRSVTISRLLGCEFLPPAPRNLESCSTTCHC